MTTPNRWTASSAHLSNLNGKWKEIKSSLRLVAFGYCVLFLFAIPGLLLIWLSQGQRTAWLFTPTSGFTRPNAQYLGLCIAGLGTLSWYALVLIGQWNCLSHAPSRHGAKELLFLCAVCLALGPTSLATAHFLGGTNPEVLLSEGLSALFQQPETHAILLLQVGGSLLIVFNLILFGGFLRAVGICVQGEQGAGPAVRSLWFVGFLIGATVGMLWTPLPGVLVTLVSGWIIGLLWHVTIIHHTYRLIDRVLTPPPQDRSRPVEDPRPRPYSGLHRYYVHVDPK